MKNWIGKYLFIVGSLHTLLGILLIAPQMTELVDEGIFNTIDGQFKREAFLWFMVSGFLMLLVGGLVNWLEKNQFPLPKFLAWSLLFIAVFVVVFSPKSGAWLFFPPAIALLFRKG